MWFFVPSGTRDLVIQSHQGFTRVVQHQQRQCIVPHSYLLFQVMVNASAEGHRAGSATGFVGERFTMAVPGAHLWSVEDPFLYDLDVVLLGGENSDGDMVSAMCVQC